MNEEKRKKIARILCDYRGERLNLAEAMERIEKTYNPELHGKEIWDKVKRNGRFSPNVR